MFFYFFLFRIILTTKNIYKEIYFSNNYYNFFFNTIEYSSIIYNTILCTIVKNENLYIKEFVEHYLAIGINKIIVYDNNEEKGEKLNQILKNYIKKGYIDIINFRGKRAAQMLSFNDCYSNNQNLYDWIMFFDIDEFLILNEYKNINNFLRNKKFKLCDVIQINWVIFDDNDLISYDNRPLNIRFTRPLYTQIMENRYVKSISRTYINLKWVDPHSPTVDFNVCNVDGKRIINKSVMFKNIALESKLKKPYLKHFKYKTVEEYYGDKLNKGDVYYKEIKWEFYIDKKYFFQINKRTREKEDIINELYKIYLISNFGIKKYIKGKFLNINFIK